MTLPLESGYIFSQLFEIRFLFVGYICVPGSHLLVFQKLPHDMVMFSAFILPPVCSS